MWPEYTKAKTKETLSLGFLFTKIKTDTAGTCFPNSWCKQHPTPLIGLRPWFYIYSASKDQLLKSSFSLKVLGVIIVGLGSLAFPAVPKKDYLCAGYFSQEAFFFNAIPYFVSFCISIGNIIFITYTKYRSILKKMGHLKFFLCFLA